MDAPQAVAYEFSGYRLDPQRRILFGVDAQPIPLKPRVFDTLLFLVEHPHELLDRRSMMEAIWPDVIVEENNLNQAISTLRRVFGEHPTDHRYIVTEPGRGYRFIATVDRVSVAQDAGITGAALQDRIIAFPGRTAPVVVSEPSAGVNEAGRGAAVWTNWRHIGAVTVAAISTIALILYMTGAQQDSRSVAVLPFENLSADEQHEIFARSIHDDVLTQLAKIQALKVIARSSVMQYQGQTLDLRNIGTQLGAATILEGTVQRTPDMMRMNVKLVDARSGELLWSESYDREPTVQNIFAVQTDIAKSIARSLEATLTPADLGRLERQPTESTRAYEFYMSGRQYYRGSDLLRDLPSAVQQFERAIDEDPRFALALAYLAMTNIHMYWTMDRNDSRRDRALSAAEKALALEPDLPEAHLAMGWYHYQGHLNYDAALHELAVAEQAMPDDVDLLFARGAIYRRMGQWQLAIASWERAIDADPRNANLLRQHATSYRMLRDYENADRYLRRVLEIAPDAVEAKIERAAIPMLRDGDASAYLQAVTGNPLLRPGEEVLDKWYVAIRSRDYDQALDQLSQWPGDLLRNSRTAYKLTAAAYGITYRLAGRPDLARAQFEIARDRLEAALAQYPEQPRLLISLGEAMAGLGEQEAAARLALRAVELMPTSREAIDGPEYQLDAIIRVLAPAGAVDDALQNLDAYLAAPGFWSIEGILPDPRLDPLRDDPRFQALVKKYRR